MELYVAALGFGLISVSVIAIAAVGFTMQFGITNMINLAYGEVMIVCAYVAFYVNRAGVNVWAAMIVAALAGAVLSFLLNRFLYAPFQRKGTNLIGMVIISLAASLILANILLPIVGYDTSSYQVDQGPLLRWNGLVLTTAQIAIIVVAVVLMLGHPQLAQIHTTGEGDARHRGQPNPGPQLRHSDPTRDRSGLASHRGPV
ncbi:MAG TPA: branched-chain amino acid ABC transporter permease, partial [Candidatus Dormibacteraeota bacterium]